MCFWFFFRNFGQYWFYGINEEDKNIFLARNTGSQYSPSLTYDYNIKNNTIYELKIVAYENNHYDFYLDNQIIWENYNLNSWMNGTIGFRSENADGKYYSLYYRQLLPTAQPTDFPTEYPTPAPVSKDLLKLDNIQCTTESNTQSWGDIISVDCPSGYVMTSCSAESTSNARPAFDGPLCLTNLFYCNPSCYL